MKTVKTVQNEEIISQHFQFLKGNGSFIKPDQWGKRNSSEIFFIIRKSIGDVKQIKDLFQTKLWAILKLQKLVFIIQ